MRFAIVSPHGVGLSWWRRLYDEGHDVLVYIPSKTENRIGDGLVPKSNNVEDLIAWATKAPQTVALFDYSGYGQLADRMRKMGVPTVGSGSFCDKLESDREYGEKIAKAVGCRVPPTKAFGSVSAAISFLKTRGDETWYFKPNNDALGKDATHGNKAHALADYLGYVQRTYGDSVSNVLQQAVPGVALSTACWWNGRTFVGPYQSTIEHKKFMDGDIGPSTGCSFNAVWFYPEDAPRVAQSLKWEALNGLFARLDAPPGLYDMNAIIAEKDGPWGPGGEAYFLEWTPRLGWDSEATSHRLLDGMGMGEFLHRLAMGRLAEVPATTSELAYSFHLSVPPYPWEHNDESKRTCIGSPISGIDGVWDGHFIGYCIKLDSAGFSMADRSGEVGLSLAVGKSLKACHDKAMAFVKDDLEVPSLQYRTDGAKCIEKDAAALAKLGYEVNKGLLK